MRNKGNRSQPKEVTRLEPPPSTGPDEGAHRQQPDLSDLGRQEFELKIKKLEFETGWGKFFEGFKAIGSIVAALGVIGTVTLALYQQRQNRVSRDDERFDRSVTRVGSSQISERLTGVAGLQQFLSSKDSDREKSALLFLVNAVAVETDPTVRSAMIDTFNSLGEIPVTTGALNAAVISARDRNRGMFKRFLSRPWGGTKDSHSYNVDFPELAMDPISAQEKDQLLGTGGVLAALIRSGAKVQDLSRVFCMNCSFAVPGKTLDLSGMSFENSMLRGASFTFVNLDGASFKDADLLGADFTSASLRNANLTAITAVEPFSLAAAYATKNLMGMRGATFACADLSAADFSGRLLFGLIFNDPIFGGFSRDEFFSADLSNTNFIGAEFFVATPQDILPVEQDPFGLGRVGPIDQGQTGGPSEPLEYVNNKYRVSTFTINANTGFTVPLKGNYRRDLIMILSSLQSARNLSSAKIPAAILRYIEQNRAVLEKPVKTYDCKGQQGFNIDQMTSSDDVGPKNMQF